MEMVANVEVRAGHDDAANECRDRCFAVERVRAVYDQAGLDGPLARLLRVHDIGTRRRCFDGAASAGNDFRARRCRVHVGRSDPRERLHERRNRRFVGGLHDHVERVFALHHRLAQDLDAVLAHVGAAQVVKHHCARVRIAGGARRGRMLMPDDK